MPLRDREWKRFLRGPDPTLLADLYVPALGESVRYDRCCSYFSSTVLAVAARGFGRLISRLEALGDAAPRPAVRLVVNEELIAEDVRALTEAGDTTVLEAALRRRFHSPTEALEKDRLAMLGWLVKRGFLEVRVGIMRRGVGMVHAKFGIATDPRGDAVVFSGSGNETAQGVVGNYERLEVSPSWEDPDRHDEYRREFESLWLDTHADVHTLSLPEALRLELIRLAPGEPPTVEPIYAIARQKAAMLWRFMVEAPYLSNGGLACDGTALVDLWPHQQRVVEETAEAWPDGRLLCDEVGMGKTIEAILILRRLLAGRGVRRVLVLLPAGLIKQWQGELREKGGLLFPRLEGTTSLVWPDDRVEKVTGLAEAVEQDQLLLSRETARTEGNMPLLLAAQPWDLVVLDESHAARRKEQEEGEFNSATLLLTLLRQLQLRQRTRGFLLLSATPMQTHPWEPWDLLSVLGEGGAWLADFSSVREYYGAILAVRNGSCGIDTARSAAALITSDPGFPPLPENGPASQLDAVAQRLAFPRPRERDSLADWMRRGSPLSRRMHRSTRDTLRQYYLRGLLADPPPRRRVDDLQFDFQDPAERSVYNNVSRYIERRFEELEQEKPGKGFVMTVYRRRGSSSPQALERSLERRREGLIRVVQRQAYDLTLLTTDVPEAIDPDDLPEGEGGNRISSALPQDPHVARQELREVEKLQEELRSLAGRDTKRDRFFDVLRQLGEDGRPVLVFTEYTDTLEYLRDLLVAHYGGALACFTGDGGQRWDGSRWHGVTKDAITRSLREGELRVLLCTDAASEGLNLQAAGAVVNYDLPWNPSRVEQRIGRIDRIGQKLSEVRVVNLFLKDSVDDRVYGALRDRCGLFEHFVGAMQPVLARARRMLAGQDPVDLAALRAVADDVGRSPLATETYVESPAWTAAAAPPPVARVDLESALAGLDSRSGPKLTVDGDLGVYCLSDSRGTVQLSGRLNVLERDRTVLPLSPFEPAIKRLADSLWFGGERLPLVVAAFERGAFRAAEAFWVTGTELFPITTAAGLRERLSTWEGGYPPPEAWLVAERSARDVAHKRVDAMESRARERAQASMERQVGAARLRLQKDLGRLLACYGFGTNDLNAVLQQQMGRDIATAQRLRRCLKRLGGYPDWPPQLCRELHAFVESLSPNQRRARLLGAELEAALEDPRWAAARANDVAAPPAAADHAG